MTGAPQRVAITGAAGRLGRALLLEASRDPALEPLPWSRPELDLDRPATATALLERDRPDLVIHAAAWTDVDGCARDPELAMARNGTATGVLARACAARGIALLVVSTNEVFDGERTDGLGYTEDDPPAPRNPYGHSKLAGEAAAGEAFSGAGSLWIARVAWLYGAPGNDFPRKIVAAADRLPPDQPLPVVADELGTPTATTDLAPALIALVRGAPPGTYHLAPGDPVSRFGWAQAVLAQLRPTRSTITVSRTRFQRASDPPPWGVLDARRAAAAGVVLPPWRISLQQELAEEPADRAGAGD